MLTYSYLAVADNFNTSAKPMHYTEGKGQSLKLKGSKNHLTNHIRSISRHWLLIHTRIHTRTHTHMHTQKCPQQSDLRKLGACLV